MSRYLRQTVITLQIESTYGVNPGAPIATDALQLTNAKPPVINRDVVDRDLIRNYMGASEQMVASRRAIFEFDVELGGSGAAGTPPTWGPLLRICGFAETITAANRVEYTPISDLFPSATINYFLAGLKYVSRGCRGMAKPMLNAYGLPILRCTVWGFDTIATAAALPATDFTAWKRPLVITDANSGDIRLGGTYATGTVTGGTVLASEGLELDIGTKLAHLPILGGESIDIVDRETTGSMSVFLDAATEVTWRTDLNTNVLTSLGFQFGNVAGNRLTVFAPNVQRLNPVGKDVDGKLFMQSELRLLPLVGNDEIRIVAR